MYKRHGEFFRFIIVGGINTINYYWIYLVLLELIKLNYLFSHVFAFCLSFVISYYLNCYVVYHVKPTLKKFIQFPLTQIVNIGLQTLLLFIFVEWFNLREVFAPFLGLIITVPITFIISKRILKANEHTNR
ncbi:GtrA family protein [Mammaliicoccus stepanovicii]|uniref:Sugar translocase in surface polysaccharides biosynthesis n=1 Tax=Mammaliicoccus stepanovicii TaxID=643214 RepID=A0A239YEZ8_9STAP|nr:GtrA family protein [Mammaliicoccus stepanovicii]PNZ75548.1 GtrA family protein [Mammaliicoccus stepanovicii]GGI42641.1 hypothetical protein GCM10010896_19430 [Mammaliicoccus stepanovicii]SNV56784.1 sugar translocase in surface polysaccharides biosynthesis [Mammaliicoccus stepanovicii]